MMLFFKDKREGMFLTLFFSSFFFFRGFSLVFYFYFWVFFQGIFFFPCRDGICKCILQQCLQRVCSLAMLVEATEQDVNFIGFFCYCFFFFFFFLTLSAICRAFFLLLFQFLMPVYNVKLFLQRVTVSIFKYFFPP